MVTIYGVIYFLPTLTGGLLGLWAGSASEAGTWNSALLFAVGSLCGLIVGMAYDLFIF